MKSSGWKLIGAVIGAALFGGCSMCQNPFDYTGAVTTPGVCPNCGYTSRAGSALTGASHSNHQFVESSVEEPPMTAGRATPTRQR